jgi:hypothetical protein
MVEALAGKTVMAVLHSMDRRRQAGELFTFGLEISGQLGHGGTLGEVPEGRSWLRLVGKKVIGAAACSAHTVVWTDGCWMPDLSVSVPTETRS